MQPIVDREQPIAVVAPCHAFDPARLQRGLDEARARGWDLRCPPDLDQRHRYHAGNDAHRLAHLHDALSDPRYGAVWIARGGSGLTRLLPRIAPEMLRSKPIIGFSDVTALHLAVHSTGGVAVHAPVVHSIGSTDKASLDHLDALLDGKPTTPLCGTIWREGEARGPLLGGNLCLLAATCGTPWQLDARGAILVIEEIGEEPYRVDRLLQQLKSAGVLDGIVGLAVGEFLGCDDDTNRWTAREVIASAVGGLDIPVLGNLPIGHGHGSSNHAFVLGGRARLSGSQLQLEPV